MATDFLSQDEVDALLRGVTGEEEEEISEDIAEGFRPYNLAKQERIVRGRMPTLEIINDRFARLLRIGIFNLIHRSPEVSVGPVKVMKYSEFVRNLVVPTNLNIVQMRPLRGNSLFIFEPKLVFAIVDNLFGGDGRYHMRVEGRDFTLTEQRIIQRILDVVFIEYQKSWAPVYQLEFDYVRSEMHTQFVNIATPSEIMVITSFSVEIGNTGGDIHICIPYATVEPIRDLLYSSMQGDQYEPDKRWLKMLQKQVQLAEVTLTADFCQTKLTVDDLMSLNIGDFIELEIPEKVIAQVDGVPIFECDFGVHEGKYAVQVDKILAIHPNENVLGDELDEAAIEQMVHSTIRS
jgi:flagellar motor switch protein FliM